MSAPVVEATHGWLLGAASASAAGFWASDLQYWPCPLRSPSWQFVGALEPPRLGTKAG